MCIRDSCYTYWFTTACMNSSMNFSYSTMIHRLLHLLLHNGLHQFINELLIFYDDPQTVTLTASQWPASIHQWTSHILRWSTNCYTYCFTMACINSLMNFSYSTMIHRLLHLLVNNGVHEFINELLIFYNDPQTVTLTGSQWPAWIHQWTSHILQWSTDCYTYWLTTACMNSLMNFSYSTMIHRLLHLLVNNGLHEFINELLIFYNDPQIVTLTGSQWPPWIHQWTSHILRRSTDCYTYCFTTACMNSSMNFSYSTMIHRLLHLLVHNGLHEFINELLIFYDDPQTVTLTGSQ